MNQWVTLRNKLCRKILQNNILPDYELLTIRKYVNVRIGAFGSKIHSLNLEEDGRIFHLFPNVPDAL